MKGRGTSASWDLTDFLYCFISTFGILFIRYLILSQADFGFRTYIKLIADRDRDSRSMAHGVRAAQTRKEPFSEKH